MNHPTDISSSLSQELASYGNEIDLHFDIVTGDTMCCDDFYEGEFQFVRFNQFSSSIGKPSPYALDSAEFLLPGFMLNEHQSRKRYQ